MDTTLQAPTHDDLEAVVEAVNRIGRAERGQNHTSLEVMRQEWSHPNFDLARDARLLRGADNAVVGYAGCYNLTEPHVSTGFFVVVDPALGGERREAVAKLLAWAEGVAESRVDEAPADARVTRRLIVPDDDHEVIGVAESRGYTFVRSFLRMRIDLDGPPQPLPLPEGFRLTSLAETKDLRAIAVADEDAFRDHYGHAPQTYDEAYKHFVHFTSTDPKFDPALWLVALADAQGDAAAAGDATGRGDGTGPGSVEPSGGKATAGICLSALEAEENPEWGYVESLAVLPAYRNRGLARAMLVRAFMELYARGRRTVALHVDAKSLTGATRLYESVGMRLDQTYNNYEQEIRPGKELRNLG